MKNTYIKPELLITLINVKDVITISESVGASGPDNDRTVGDLELWPD